MRKDIYATIGIEARIIMKKYVKNFVASFILISILCSLISCSKGEKNPAFEFPPAEGCQVSSVRTGTQRQGIYSMGNGFECTENGAYFMCRPSKSTNYWLLYADHGSDTVIKLCGRPDCTHSDSECNAFFRTGVNICYYDGYLYTYGSIGDSVFGRMGLIRMNLDGSGRELVYNLSDFEKENGYGGMSGCEIFNGMFCFNLTKLDENGKTVSHSYYYKLDGSMKEPERGGISFSAVDGDVILGINGFNQETQEYTYGKWDPENGKTELFKADKSCSGGYLAADAYFYIEDGIIYKYVYDTKKTIPLADTGLKEGTYQLKCFPDMIIVSDFVSEEDRRNDPTLGDLTLHFYDWSFKSLGSVNIDYEFNPGLPGVICGETHERLMLTDAYDLVPRYYINKSDIGSGKIEIHKYNLPDFE